MLFFHPVLFIYSTTILWLINLATNITLLALLLAKMSAKFHYMHEGSLAKKLNLTCKSRLGFFIYLSTNSGDKDLYQLS